MSDKDLKAIVGIDPATRHCCFIAEDTEDSWLEAREQGLIVVPVSAETARETFGNDVDDVCALAGEA